MNISSLKKALGRVVFILAYASCTTLPTVSHSKHSFPKEVFLEDPKRPYEKLGLVRTKVTYPTLDSEHDENMLCINYFNKAAEDLLKRAREKGADAVIGVRSVVFLVDGRQEMYSRAECADDGEEGQVLAQGIAVKWKRE